MKFRHFGTLLIFAVLYAPASHASLSGWINTQLTRFSGAEKSDSAMIQLTPRDTAKRLYIEAAMFHMRRNNDFGMAIGLEVATRYLEQNGTDRFVEFFRVVNAVDSEYRELLRRSQGRANNNPFKGTSGEAASLFLEAAKTVADRTPYGRAFAQGTEIFLTTNSLIYDAAMGPLDQQQAQLDLFKRQLKFESVAEAALDRAWTLAATHAQINPDGTVARDRGVPGLLSTYVGDRLPFGILADSSEILDPKRNLDFALANALQKFEPFIGPDGLKISRAQLDALTAEIRAELKKFTADLASQLAENREATQNLSREILERDRAAAEKAAEQAQKRKEAELFQLRSEGTRAVFNLSGFLLGQLDPAAGRAVSTVGAAGVTIAQAVNVFNATNAGLVSGMDKFLSGAMLSWNVVGALMNVANLFQIGGPSFEQVIQNDLNEIKSMISLVSQQLKDMGKQLNGRFDLVDMQLAVLLQASAQQFGLLCEILQQTRAYNEQVQLKLDHVIEQIGTNYFRTSGTISRMNSDINLQFRAMADLLHRENMDYCLDAESISIGSLGINRFGECLSKAKTYASVHSQDAIGSVPVDSEMTPSGVLDYLKSRRPEQLVDYLLAYLSKESPGLLPEPSAIPGAGNPAVWAAGAQQFLTLLLELPSYAATVNSEWLFGSSKRRGAITELVNRGDRLARRAAALKANLDEKGEWQPNRPFWDARLNKYEAALINLEAGYKQVRKDYVAEKTYGFDPWREWDQQIPNPGFPNHEGWKNFQIDFAPGQSVPLGVHLADQLSPFKRNLLKAGVLNPKLSYRRWVTDALPELGCTLGWLDVQQRKVAHLEVTLEIEPGWTVSLKGESAPFRDGCAGRIPNACNHSCFARESDDEPPVWLPDPSPDLNYEAIRGSDCVLHGVSKRCGNSVRSSSAISVRNFKQEINTIQEAFAQIIATAAAREFSRQTDADWRQRLGNRLDLRRAEMQNAFLEALPGRIGILSTRFDAVDLEAGLISALIPMAFPVSFQSSDVLRAFVSGSQKLFSGTELQRATGVAQGESRQVIRCLVSPYICEVEFPSLPYQRAEAFRKVLDDIFIRDPAPEVDPELTRTLEALRLYQGRFSTKESRAEAPSPRDRSLSVIIAKRDFHEIPFDAQGQNDVFEAQASNPASCLFRRRS